ncbi:hypothetical protein Acr_26g0000320 [Actinidia rufa]|uniref:Uncharacterized protein n=1 Tax=Actinidia rufa TaxID=165716 RepID=A0A7J0H138_9ERIC|nr:hypothetical protein Acr_26g0000320 [Actinidia rufa]
MRTFPSLNSRLGRGEEQKEEEETPQLVLNRRRNRVIPDKEPEVPTWLISIFSLDSEHPYDLAFNPFQLVCEVEIVRGGDPKSRSVSGNMRKQPIGGPSQKSKTKKGKGNSSGQAKLWKPKFSTAELGKQVTVADSTKDHDTNLALARAIMLPKDIANLVEEGSEEIRNPMRDAAISECMRSAELKKTKKKDVSNVATTLAQNEATASGTRHFKISPSFRKNTYQPAEESGEEAQAVEAIEIEGKVAAEKIGKVTAEAEKKAAEAGEVAAKVGEVAAQDPPNKL